MAKERSTSETLTNDLAQYMHRLSKHDQIRLKHWLHKLSIPTSNEVWKQNRDLHMRVLVEMVKMGELSKPFSSSPPEGPLPKLSLYDIAYPVRVRVCGDTDVHERNEKKLCEFDNESAFASRKNSIGKENRRKNSLSRGKSIERMKKCTALDRLESTKYSSENLFENYEPNKTQKMLFKAKNEMNDIDSGLVVVEKILKFLWDHHESFENNQEFLPLIKKLVKNIDKNGKNALSQKFRNEYESKVDICNKRIKEKLLETDLNSLEFMKYLNSLS